MLASDIKMVLLKDIYRFDYGKHLIDDMLIDLGIARRTWTTMRKNDIGFLKAHQIRVMMKYGEFKVDMCSYIQGAEVKECVIES